MKRLMTILALAATLLGAGNVQAKKAQKAKPIAIVAHRGFWNCDESGKAKNSMASITQAQANGFWGSEFDVNITKDGQLIVFHDSKIEGKLIEQHDFAEFKDYKLKNGESIPTLDSYLEQGKKSKTMLVFEMKPHSCKEVEDLAVEKSIQMLKEKGLLKKKRVMFISFSMNACKEFAKRLPGFTVQYLDTDYTPDQVFAEGINGIDTHHPTLAKDRSIYDQARSHKMSINCWTVNKEEDMRKMIELGVDQITTDNPLQLRALLKEYGIKERK